MEQPDRHQGRDQAFVNDRTPTVRSPWKQFRNNDCGQGRGRRIAKRPPDLFTEWHSVTEQHECGTGQQGTQRQQTDRTVHVNVMSTHHRRFLYRFSAQIPLTMPTITDTSKPRRNGNPCDSHAATPVNIIETSMGRLLARGMVIAIKARTAANSSDQDVGTTDP